MTKVVDQWPVLAGQLERALKIDGHLDLATQVKELTVLEDCGCGDSFCQSFYTAPKPEGSYGPGHSNLLLEPPWPGWLILDVVDGRIMFVEVLHRPPLD